METRIGWLCKLMELVQKDFQNTGRRMWPVLWEDSELDCADGRLDTYREICKRNFCRGLNFDILRIEVSCLEDGLLGRLEYLPELRQHLIRINSSIRTDVKAAETLIHELVHHITPWTCKYEEEDHIYFWEFLDELGYGKGEDDPPNLKLQALLDKLGLYPFEIH